MQPIPSPAAVPPDITVIVPCYKERDNIAPMVRALDAALIGFAWEVVFVDDDSPDGTSAEIYRLARQDSRVRGIRRLGRRGLASAVIEGILSSSAPYVAVIDGDLQHDETRLPEMITMLRDNVCDLVVGSRHEEGGDAAGLSSPLRHRLSALGIACANAVLPVRLSDPMSGFFAMRRSVFESLAPRLTGHGFKILLDIVLAAAPGLRVREIPFRFRERLAGESKLDILVLVQFVGLLLDKMFGGLLPLRFVAFGCVGLFGVVVQLLVLMLLRHTGMNFEWSQGLATALAMIANFQMNNSLTYRPQKLRGGRYWGGLVLFMVVCSLGAVANIGIGSLLYHRHEGWNLAGAAGAAVGVVWNYAVSATLVWRVR